jgi:hypothetical protein
VRLKPWQDAIMDKLRESINSKVPIEDGGYGEGSDEVVGRLDNGMLQPYILVWFGGSVDTGPGYATIGGVRQESRLAMLHFECVGPTGTMARDLGDEVRDALVGFRPDGEGELEEDGMPTIRNPISTTTGLDVRYTYPMTFKGIVNTKL